jgi:hypothetical protein
MFMCLKKVEEEEEEEDLFVFNDTIEGPRLLAGQEKEGGEGTQNNQSFKL